jgi:sortase A
MSDKRSVDDLSVEELERLLYSKKRGQRRRRLRRLKEAGRVVEVAGLAPPNPKPPPLLRPNATPTGAMQHYMLELDGGAEPIPGTVEETAPQRAIQWRWVANKLLLLVEIAAVLGLVLVLSGLWDTRQELNQELAQAQRKESQSLALPTPTATPIIDVVVLPSGHKPPVDGRSPEQGEAGDIPAHLLPAINAYVPPPIPTPGPEQARRLQIPAIDVDSPVVQGTDWEQLKKGVGHHIGSTQPGQIGNLVLAAHNDIFGEIFRHLDRLAPGDEIIVSTERQSYTYIVTKIEVVAPTAVEIMASTDYPSATLISCYPYGVNTNRIVVFADLITGPLS